MLWFSRPQHDAEENLGATGPSQIGNLYIKSVAMERFS